MIFAFALGLISVLQAGLNRRIGGQYGIVAATLLNNSVLMVASLGLFVAFKIFSPPQASAEANASPTPLWCIVPGVLGLFLVAGIPYVIERFGALKVFAPLIASQLVGSILWDLALEGKPLSILRVSGAVVSLIGAILVSL